MVKRLLTKIPPMLHIKKRLKRVEDETFVLSKYYVDERMDTQKTKWLNFQIRKYSSKETLNRDSNQKTMLLSIIMVICGTVLIFNPFKGAVLLTRLVGIFILIYAILDLISTLVIKSNFNKIHDAIEEGVKEADIVEERDNKKKSKGKEKNK